MITIEDNTKKEEIVHQAIRIILQDKKSYTTSLNYGVEYCKAALHMDSYPLAVQCLYILNNITHWHHPKAKEVRTILKQFAKENNL